MGIGSPQLDTINNAHESEAKQEKGWMSQPVLYTVHKELIVECALGYN